jgi:hypothetical protein
MSDLSSVEVPRLVYRKGGKPDQRDVLGNDVLRVEDHLALASALHDGWSLTPITFDPDAVTPAEPSVVGDVLDDPAPEPVQDVEPDHVEAAPRRRR